MSASTAARPAALAPRLALAGAVALAALDLALTLPTPARMSGTAGGASLWGADFRIFRDSGAAWLAGRDPFAPMPYPNLNHPILLPLFALLSRLPADAAYALWCALATAVYAATLAAAWRVARPPMDARSLATLGALAVAAPGLLATLFWGQMGVALGAGATALWRLLRRDRALAAGAVAGLLIALKPSFLPLACLFLAPGRRRGLAGLALGGGAPTLAALPLVGVGGVLAWARTLAHIDHYLQPQNVSLIGFVAHTVGGDPPAALAWALELLAPLAVAALAMAWPRRAAAGADRDVAAALLLCQLCAPLGWVHYTATLVPVAGTLVRRRRRLAVATRRALWPAVAALWTPFLLGYGGLPTDRADTLGLLVLLAVVVAIHRPVPRPAQPTARGE